MYRNVGDCVHLEYANELNIPILSYCGIEKPQTKGGMWSWESLCYMPRKEAIISHFHIEAPTKGEIIEALNKHVVPLYEIALKAMKDGKALYYWK